MKEDTMQLTLTPQEQEVLSGAVKSAISDFGTEVSHTDNQAMRQGLQKRKKVLLAILDRLKALPESVFSGKVRGTHMRLSGEDVCPDRSLPGICG